MDVTVCGKLVSVVRQEMTFFKPVLNINDANDQPLLRVKGPVSTTGEADFRVSDLDLGKAEGQVRFWFWVKTIQATVKMLWCRQAWVRTSTRTSAVLKAS